MKLLKWYEFLSTLTGWDKHKQRTFVMLLDHEGFYYEKLYEPRVV